MNTETKTNQGAAVDVLAVMDRAADEMAGASELIDECPGVDVLDAASNGLSEAGRDLSEARAAVAELIALAGELLANPSDVGAQRRLQSCLARVGGAA